jgi:hypothetical protein
MKLITGRSIWLLLAALLCGCVSAGCLYYTENWAGLPLDAVLLSLILLPFTYIVGIVSAILAVYLLVEYFFFAEHGL